jgi:hypothetical protein
MHELPGYLALTPEITVIYAAENTQRFTLPSIGHFGYNWPEIHAGSFGSAMLWF